MSNTETEIASVEEELRKAMLSSDVIALDMLLSPNLVFTNHMGQVISKHDDIEGHKSGDLNIENLSLSEQLIKPIDELALVSVRAKVSGSYKGAPTKGEFRFTRIWGNNNGSWQVIAGHSSIVA